MAAEPLTQRMVYVTTTGKDEAIRIGREVVKARLAACANIIEPMTSIYWWKGTLEEDHGTVLILKTTESRVEPLIAKIRSIHSYECPCIVAFPIVQGFEGYLKWMIDETTP